MLMNLNSFLNTNFIKFILFGKKKEKKNKLFERVWINSELNIDNEERHLEEIKENVKTKWAITEKFILKYKEINEDNNKNKKHINGID